MTEREMLDYGYRYAFSLAHDGEDAADLVQEAFFRLYRKYGKVATKAVLLTTIRNLFFDLCRRPKLVIHLDYPEDIERIPEKIMVQPGTSLDLNEVLSHLRLEEREALYLNAIEGFSAREIAELTGRSRNTVLSLMHRAKKKLKLEIEKEAKYAKGGKHHE